MATKKTTKSAPEMEPQSEMDGVLDQIASDLNVAKAGALDCLDALGSAAKRGAHYLALMVEGRTR